MTHLVEIEEELKHHTELQESQQKAKFEFDDVWIQSNFIQFMKETKSLSQEEEELIRTFDNHLIPKKYVLIQKQNYVDNMDKWLVFLLKDAKETESYRSAVTSIKLYLDRVAMHHYQEGWQWLFGESTIVQIWFQILNEPQLIKSAQSKFIEFMKVHVSLSQDEEDSIRAFDKHYIPMQYMRDDILTPWLTFMSKDETESNFDLFLEWDVILSYLRQVVKHHNIGDGWNQSACRKQFPLSTGTWDCIYELQDYNDRMQRNFISLMGEKLALSQEEKDSIRTFYHNYIPMKYMNDDILSQFLEDQNDVSTRAYLDQLMKHHSFADEWSECGEHFPQSTRTWDGIVEKYKQGNQSIQSHFISFMIDKLSILPQEAESIRAFDNHYIPIEYMHDTFLSRWLSSSGFREIEDHYVVDKLQAYLDRIVQCHSIDEEWIKCGESFPEAIRTWHNIVAELQESELRQNKNIQSKFIQFMKQNESLSQDEETSIRTFDYHYIPVEYMRDDILSQWLLFEFNTSISDDIAIRQYNTYLNGVVKHHNFNNTWDGIRVYLLFPQAKAAWSHLLQMFSRMGNDEAIVWQFTQFIKRNASKSEEKEQSKSEKIQEKEESKSEEKEESKPEEIQEKEKSKSEEKEKSKSEEIQAKEESIPEFDHNYIPVEFLEQFLKQFLVQFSNHRKKCLQDKKISDRSYITRIRLMDLYLCDVVRHHNIDGEFPFDQYKDHWRNWHEIVADALQLRKKTDAGPKKKTCVDASQLYYILRKNRVSGPHTVDEIALLYIRKEINAGDTLYVSSAKDSESTWVELQIPEAPGDANGEQLSAKNYEIRAEPELYAFVLELALHEVTQIQPPKDIPENVNEQRSQIMMVLRRVLGRIVFAIIAIIIVIHMVPLGMPLIVIMIILDRFCACCDFMYGSFMTSIYWSMLFIGFISTPIIVCHHILTATDIYDEIQSWMIAYITWGTASFMLFEVFVIAVRLTNKKKQEQWMKLGSAIVFYIVGVDLGKMDFVNMIRNLDILSTNVTAFVLLMLPTCAALLPAAIAGFIANFVLEEKFQLKCDNRIVDGDLCFSNGYGCCEVISSHNVTNGFVFIGGLASNILASWAMIRLCGYLLVNAFSKFSAHANRKVRG